MAKLFKNENMNNFSKIANNLLPLDTSDNAKSKIKGIFFNTNNFLHHIIHNTQALFQNRFLDHPYHIYNQTILFNDFCTTKRLKQKYFINGQIFGTTRTANIIFHIILHILQFITTHETTKFHTNFYQLRQFVLKNNK